MRVHSCLDPRDNCLNLGVLKEEQHEILMLASSDGPIDHLILIVITHGTTKRFIFVFSVSYSSIFSLPLSFSAACSHGVLHEAAVLRNIG